MSDHTTHWDDLCDFAESVRQQTNVPGVALGILHQGEIATAGFGLTNVDHPLPVTDETLFQIGSITKTFTGTLIMRLVEMGKVDLDATVRTYLPEFRVVDETASTQTTVRNLLTHTSGWAGDFFIDTGWGDDALPRFVARMAELVQLAPPNSVWSYNNAAFSLAGAIIEHVTEQTYESVLKELVLGPLGLSNAFLQPADVMTHRFAGGHASGEQGPQVARPWALPRCLWPAGGIICHVRDLLRYARFHLGDGRTPDDYRLLSTESMTQMQSPQVTVWGKETWGLSWGLGEINGSRRVSHGGSTKGQNALLALLPAHDFAIAILTNADHGGKVIREISQRALKDYLGLEEAKPEAIDSTVEALRVFAGSYSRPNADLELGILGRRLIGQVTYKGGFPTEDTPIPPPSPPASLALCEQDRLLVMDGPMKDAKIDVVRKADGTIGWLRSGGRIHPRQALNGHDNQAIPHRRT